MDKITHHTMKKCDCHHSTHCLDSVATKLHVANSLSKVTQRMECHLLTRTIKVGFGATEQIIVNRKLAILC